MGKKATKKIGNQPVSLIVYSTKVERTTSVERPRGGPHGIALSGRTGARRITLYRRPLPPHGARGRRRIRAGARPGKNDRPDRHRTLAQKKVSHAKTARGDFFLRAARSQERTPATTRAAVRPEDARRFRHASRR